jgi:hypothetical protein
MKQAYLLIILFLVALGANAKQIDENTAKKVGRNFLVHNTSNFDENITLDLVFTSSSVEKSSPIDVKLPTNYYYVFNISSNGYIIVSADDIVYPILGYSYESNFSTSNLPIQTAKWFEGYKNQIRFAIANSYNATNDISKEWNALLNPTSGKQMKKKAGVAPLVQAKWDQSPYYNSYCPYDKKEIDTTVTGCVATGMAQVMYFWQHPKRGVGSHSFKHQKYGTLSANFGQTTYDWDNMYDSITEYNPAVATLMAHCGVATEMNYDVSAKGGSGTYVISYDGEKNNSAEYALKNFFGYDSTTLKGMDKEYFTDAQWLTMLKLEFDSSRPIVYAGAGNGGGHCFVADGYDANDFVHFNWGWSAYYNGFFKMGALNPDGLGTGGGTGGYNNSHEAIIGIKPEPDSNGFFSGGVTSPDLRLNSDIVVNPSSISYNNPFTVEFDVKNASTTASGNFQGDYAVGIFNENDVFIAFVAEVKNQTLNFNSITSSKISFNVPAQSKMTPGKYKIGAYYKANGGKKFISLKNGGHMNFITVKVEHINGLNLTTYIETDNEEIYLNETFTVSFNIKNTESTTFSGDIGVDLYDVDGDSLLEIGTLKGLTLNTNQSFSKNLEITLNGGLDIEPGTYLMVAKSKTAGGAWELIGEDTFYNPEDIFFVIEPIDPDQYEYNDTFKAAYKLPVNFVGDSARIKTVDANCHDGLDYDYYKMDLATGYTYTMTPLLHNSYISGDGNEYTLEALFSYTEDGVTFSESYDYKFDNDIVVQGPKTVYFFVSRYYAGEEGTYALDVNIKRKGTNGINNNVLAELVTIYPNPANNAISIELLSNNNKIKGLTIQNIEGKTVNTLTIQDQSNTATVDISNLTAGVYTVSLETTEGLIRKKLIVQ